MCIYTKLQGKIILIEEMQFAEHLSIKSRKNFFQMVFYYQSLIRAPYFRLIHTLSHKISRKMQKKCQVTSSNDMDVDRRRSRFSCLHAPKRKRTIARGSIGCCRISITLCLWIYWPFSSNSEINAPGEVIPTLHPPARVSIHFF